MMMISAYVCEREEQEEEEEAEKGEIVERKKASLTTAGNGMEIRRITRITRKK